MRRLTIRATADVKLRIMVQVSKHCADKVWLVQYLDRSHAHERRSDAVLAAKMICEAWLDQGIFSELVVKRRNGTVGETRTYGGDPKETRG